MKNFLISIVLGLSITSCTQPKHTSLDNKYAQTDNYKVYSKYNYINCIQSEKRKKQLVHQLAIARQE